MAKDQKTPVTINDKEYFVEDLTQEAKMLIDHVNDFDRKLSVNQFTACLLYTSPSPRDRTRSRMPSSA